MGPPRAGHPLLLAGYVLQHEHGAGKGAAFLDAGKAFVEARVGEAVAPESAADPFFAAALPRDVVNAQRPG